MLATSLEFRKRIAQNTKTVHKATLTLADDTVIELVGDDMMDGISFSESTSSSSSFEIGAAVIGRHDFVLRNDDSRFDDYDFTGATVIPYVGVELDDETTEWLRKGVYGIEQPSSYSNTIKLSALDNMRLFEKPYSDVNTSYPASLLTILSDICTSCGVTLATTTFANYTATVAKRPDDDALTCLDMVSYVAQTSGNWAKCDTLGRLKLGWYDTSILEGVDWVDGGTFLTDTTPYSDGDEADGGGFHTEDDSLDGGSFATIPYAHLFAFSSLTVTTDDVVITGVRVTAVDEVTAGGTKGNDGETSLYGSEGYVLEVSGNPLIQYGTASTAAARIGARCVGMRFRPFDASVIGDPSYEAGDAAILTDGKQRQYKSFITNCTWRNGSYQSLSCGAETPSRNSATSYSALTKAIVEARNAAKSEKTAREIAMETMALMLSSASGLYKTAETQSDGSVIYYLHDKPTKAASSTVWKATAEAFGVSTDGGATYSYGVSNNGVAILNQIYAQGIDADYITTGAITVRDPNDTTKVIFRADVALKNVTIGGFNVNDSALYNGPASLSSSTAGVYVGDDGVKVNKVVGNSQYGAKLADGALEFNDSQGRVGVIDGSGFGSAGCMLIAGADDGIVFYAPKTYVDDGNQGVLYGRGVETISNSGGNTSTNSHYSTRFVPQSLNNNVLTGYMRLVFPKHINGMFTGSSTGYWSVVGNGNIDIPLKAYVDNKVPTFTLSGSNLYISL